MNIMLIDWVIILGYIAFIFILALKTAKLAQNNSEQDAREQYLANRSLTFTESLCSIIATEVSALTFLGIPAFAFNTNFSFVQIYMGAIFARLVIALVFLPKIYNQGLTIYEIMAQNSPFPGGRRTVASFYSLAKIFSVGVRLFSGSILVAHFMNLNLYLGLAMVTFITFLYTLIGGLKAVVRTDILQMGLFIFGGLTAHFLIPEVSGSSWSNLMGIAHAAGKTTFFDFSNPSSFLLGILGGVLFDMATHGVDQDFAQRLMANKNMRKAQWAIFLSSFLSIAVGFLFLGIGALLWAHYQSHPMPESVQSADHLFSYFIVNHFPAGIRGLMVAGVMAATMSTLDSTINALCATVYNDIFPKRISSHLKFFSLFDTFIITALLFIIAVISSKNDGLLMLGLKIQSWTAGTLLALFMSQVLFKRWFSYKLDFFSVIGAYAFGTFGVYLNTSVLKWDWNLNVYLGWAMALMWLKLYSMRAQATREN